MGVSTAALLTSMESPLGQAVGNALEVAEAVQCLRGQGPADLTELVVALGGRLLTLAGQGPPEQGRHRLAACLQNGSALATFERMLVAQGVEEAVAAKLCHGDTWGVLAPAETEEPLPAGEAGERAIAAGARMTPLPQTDVY